MRIAVPDLISPSYFPAIAAVELGLVREEGVDVELELLFPVTDAAEALRTGKIDFLVGAAHAPMHAFPEWSGVKLVAALSQHMYWFLVVRSDLNLGRGELGALRDLRIGAAPGPDLGLRVLLAEAGIDAEERGVHIGPVPAVAGAGTSFGVAAAKALEAGAIDGFWANGMGAELALRRGTGTLVLDARRGDGPHGGQCLHLPRARGHRRHHRTEPRRRHRRDPRDRPCPTAVARGSAPGDRGGHRAVPRAGNLHDRRAGAARRPVLRPGDLRGLRACARRFRPPRGPDRHHSGLRPDRHPRFRHLWR